MMKRMELVSPLGSLEAYTQSVFQIPVLSAEEEKALAFRLRDDNDLDAARQLVLANLRHVVYIARGYNGYGLAQGDLIQEGNVGLMKAVKRFNPDMNVRLISFAVHWVRAEIHEFILRIWRIVKVATTKAQRKLFFNLRSSKKRLGWFSKDEVDAVARDLGVTAKDVLEMESRMSHIDTSFDSPVDDAGHGDDGFVASPAGYLTDMRDDPAVILEQADWQESKTDRLRDALDALNERSRDILESRWLGEKKATLHELAAKYEVSAERIRQIENSAIKTLKAALEG